MTLYGGLPDVGSCDFLDSLLARHLELHLPKMGISKLSGELLLYLVPRVLCLVSVPAGGQALWEYPKNDTVTAVCCRGMIACPALGFLLLIETQSCPPPIDSSRILFFSYPVFSTIVV